MRHPGLLIPATAGLYFTWTIWFPPVVGAAVWIFVFVATLLGMAA